MRLRTSLVLTLALGIVLAAVVAGASAQEAVEAEAPVCYDCHDPVHMSHTVHSALDTRDLAAKADAENSCQACHGDPTEHMDSGGEEGTIFNFGDNVATADKIARCQTCHGGAHPGFKKSNHARAGMDCTTCHTAHDEEAKFAQLKPWPETESSHESLRVSGVCQECHAEVFAQFAYNERHKLHEGIVECNDCHDPHERSGRMLLGGFKRAMCANCHADKDGPFVFEHGSSRVDDCIACHTPHGSPNRHLLLYQNVAELCFSCHTAVPGFHSRFTLESQCTNCHVSIHGSNLDHAFLR